MTLSEFAQVMQSSGIDNARAVFEKERKQLPYAVFFDAEFDPVYANGELVYLSTGISVELHTAKHDMYSERTLESTFKQNKVKFSKVSRLWVDDEKAMLTTYNVYI